MRRSMRQNLAWDASAILTPAYRVLCSLESETLPFINMTSNFLPISDK